MVSKQEVIKYLITLSVMMGIIFGTTHFLIKPVVVSGESMENTFHDGNYLLVNRMSYQIGEPSHGDVVVFKNGGELLIKRVIGIPGDTIAIHDGELMRNGHLITEDYIKEKMDTEDIAVEVDDGTIFCMGDNRNASYDSREIGVIKMKDVLGKVITKK